MAKQFEVFNYSTKQKEWIPEDQIQQAILNKTHGFGVDDLVPVLKPDGSMVNVTATNLYKDLKNGSTILTDSVSQNKLAQQQAEIKQQKIEEIRNIPGSSLIAGAAEFADTVLMGIPSLATAGAAALGSKTAAELLENRKLFREESPIATTVGEIGGFIAGGIGTVAEKALVKGVGATTSKIAGEAVINQGIKTIGTGVLKGAAAGLTGTITSQAKEWSLNKEDRDLIEEQMLSNFMYGTALGGMTGGLFSAGAININNIAGTQAFKKVKEKAIDPVKDKIAELATPTAEKISNIRETLRLDPAKYENLSLQKELQEEFDNSIKMFVKNHIDPDQNIKTIEDIKDILSKSNLAINKKTRDLVKENIYHEIKNYSLFKDIMPKTAIKIDKELNDIINLAINKDAVDDITNIFSYKTQTDDRLLSKILKNEHNKSTIRKAINNIDSTDSEVLSVLYKNLSPFALTKDTTAGIVNLAKKIVIPAAAYGLGGIPYAIAAGVVNELFPDLTKYILKYGLKTGEKLVLDNYKTLLTATGKKTLTSISKDNINEVKNNLQQAKDEAEQSIVDELNKAKDNGYDTDEAFQQQMKILQQYSNLVNELYSSIPTEKIGSISGIPRMPSQAEFDKFNKKAQALLDPVGLLNSETITPDQINIVKKFYPNLYSKIFTARMTNIQNKLLTNPMQINKIQSIHAPAEDKQDSSGLSKKSTKALPGTQKSNIGSAGE